MKGKIIKIISILIIILFSLGLFYGCNNNLDKVEKESKPSMEESRKILVESNKEYKIKDDFMIVGKIGDNNFLANNINNKKDLYKYNILNNNNSKITSVYEKEKFIDIIDSNEDWIVWVEHESKIIDTNNLPFNWNIVSYNMKSGEKKLLEKSTFGSRNKGSIRYSYTPLDIKIHNNNVLYTRPYEEDGELKIDIVVYNLINNKVKVLDTISNIPENNIESISISGNKVVWNKMSDCADGKESPKYNFPYEKYNIFIYDLKTNKKEELRFDDKSLYYSVKIYNNYISLIKVFEEREFYSELIIYNLDNREVEIIAGEKEKIYNKDNTDTLKGNQIINENYIGWSEDGNGNLYVYDRANNSFIDLMSKSKNEYEENYSTGNIYNIWGNYIYVLGADKDGYQINSIYKLK